MSPLWRDEVGVYLAQRRVCLVRLRRGIKPTLALEADHVDLEAATGWDAAVTLLDQHISGEEWSNAKARVVIADQWVRYSVLPWSDALTSASEQMAHARELMAGVFGADMGDWTVTLSDAPPGSSRLASAMPTELLLALRGCATRHRLKLVSVQPRLIASYNTWRHVLPADAAAWFVTVEEGSLAALRLSREGIDRVHAVRIGTDWARELKRLQTFGRLASTSFLWSASEVTYGDVPPSPIAGEETL